MIGRTFRDLAWWQKIILTLCIVHLVLFAFDAWQGFEPFLRGDRSWDRWNSMDYFLGHRSDGLIPAMARSGVVPGEYLLHLPYWWVAGRFGMTLFQVGLSISSVVALGAIAKRLFIWQPAPVVVGLSYAFIPQTLAFSHQFVTEGVASSLVVLSMYCALRLWEGRQVRFALLSGALFGIAIFVRPSLVLALPPLVLLGFWACYVLRQNLYIGISVIAAVGFIPLALWVALFTAETGNVGYTSGVANLNWNLRSRVFLVQTATGTPKIPEVAQFESYPSLYADPGGISVKRFLEVASKDPISYVKGALVDQLITFGKGNTTKLTVDYLGIAGDKGLKQWRNYYERGGMSGLASWAGRNADVIFVTLVELMASLVTLPLTICASLLALWALLRPRSFVDRFGDKGLFIAYFTLAILVSVAISAVMVDRAQAKLRHPAEAGFVLMLGFAWLIANDYWMTWGKDKLHAFRASIGKTLSKRQN